MENDPKLEEVTGVQVEDALLKPTRQGFAQLRILNPSGFTQSIEEGFVLGEAVEATIVSSKNESQEGCGSEAVLLAGVRNAQEGPMDSELFKRVMSVEQEPVRKRKLMEQLEEPHLPEPEKSRLCEFLADHHEAFSLEEGERGETDLIQMEIDTGSAPPKKQPVRRMPFAVRQEVATQLKKMQKYGVIQPSKSPWASPVVLVRKWDSLHRFCMDYRGLNAVTKADTFPLPRINNLLDQLGNSRYFSTLDLASGFWQIRVHPHSQEKTAFITPQGLFEFRVMPFSLTNAPAIFQRLMEEVLRGINPESGPDFVSAYIDDILVFSSTLEEHLAHLELVMKRLEEVGLKLRPTKYRFACEEVEYLGHVITPKGLKPNPRLIAAIREFPVPSSIPDVRRFLGLASYYRRFIPRFVKIAQSLYQLTCKGASFSWPEDRCSAFENLRTRLSEAPVLAYPSFEEDFTLETDASIQGLGAVLSQPQEDRKLHPVAFASRALNPQEKNYAIAELETLAVVWAVTHFHHYLYGHQVTVYTDHGAVKAVLETPNPLGKHARWWTRVYGSGVKEVQVVYRAGKENTAADALSRSPQAAAPVKGIAEDDFQIAAMSVSKTKGTEPLATSV